MKSHIPTILFAILAVVFLVLYLTKDPTPIPDTLDERERLRSERDSLVEVVSAREKRIDLMMESLRDSDQELDRNQKQIDELKNRPPYEPPPTIIAASTEWDSIFSANGIPGHTYLLVPRTK